MKSTDTIDPNSLNTPTEASGTQELTAQIRRDVRRHTGGRVHNLTVVMTGTHVVLEGFCSNFHSYQLAQHAAMRAAEDFSVDNRIEVL
ncbi:MAG: hypothetical protein VX970_01005 [Planctomycetota bacterium]|nr:hypothetical protein [Planctomycetota bacterium]